MTYFQEQFQSSSYDPFVGRSWVSVLLFVLVSSCSLHRTECYPSNNQTKSACLLIKIFWHVQLIHCNLVASRQQYSNFLLGKYKWCKFSGLLINRLRFESYFHQGHVWFCACESHQQNITDCNTGGAI